MIFRPSLPKTIIWISDFQNNLSITANRNWRRSHQTGSEVISQKLFDVLTGNLVYGLEIHFWGYFLVSWSQWWDMKTKSMWPPYWIKNLKRFSVATNPVECRVFILLKHSSVTAFWIWPNRKWTHILANLWSINLKLAVRAYSHALNIMTSSYHSKSGLSGCLVPSLLLALLIFFGRIWIHQRS